jgi:hypothetical protein
MKKIYGKLICLAMIIALNIGGLSSIGKTLAEFNDEEKADANSYAAGVLDLGTDTENMGVVALNNYEYLSVIDQGTLPFEYRTTLNILSGSDTTFCGQLNIMMSQNTDILYNGPLSGLSFTKIVDAQDDLNFIIDDLFDNASGKVCQFKFVFKAWQDELDYSQGFTDREEIRAVVYSDGTDMPTAPAGSVVLNEFLPNPQGFEYGWDFGADADSMPKGEWVELYNSADVEVDLAGWYIKDLANHTINITAANTSPATTMISAKGWLVVYMNGAILNNDSDTIRLYNLADVLQDETNYSGGDYCDMEPTQGEKNNTNPEEDSCSSVPPNKSYARIPDGYGAWIDPIPTPGGTNATPENLAIVEELENSERANNNATTTEEIIENTDVLENTTTTEEQITDNSQQTTAANTGQANDTQQTTEELTVEEPNEPVIETPEQVEAILPENNEEDLNNNEEQITTEEIIPPEETVAEPVAVVEEAPAPEAPSGGSEE